MKSIFFISVALILVVCLQNGMMAQQVIPLYSGAIPNSTNAPDSEYYNKDSSLAFKVSKPTLTIFQPEAAKAGGTAMIVCPGGGYHTELVKWEGSDIARRLNKKGITAFVLKYRLPSNVTMKDKSIGPLQDAQQAIYLVRKNATKWNINPDKIGIIGFSAGGHLASTAGTHFEHPVIEHGNISVRPDFMVLVYPVISMKEGITHHGSRENLLGKEPSPQKVILFSNALQVDTLTPPAFITVAEDDKIVPIQNSLLFFHAMLNYKRPVAMHFYQQGGHGFKNYPPRAEWMNDMFFWMRTNKWLP